MFPRVLTFSFWSEEWKAPEEWLTSLESALKSHRVVVHRGGDYDGWDLDAWCGVLGGARLLMTVEEHGGGKQLLRFRAVPKFGAAAWGTMLSVAALAAAAALDQAWIAGALLGVFGALFLGRAVAEFSDTASSLKRALQQLGADRIS